MTYMQPTPQEMLARQNVFHTIQQIALATIPRAHVELFGSCSNGLYLPTRLAVIMFAVLAEFDGLHPQRYRHRYIYFDGNEH